MGYAGTELFTNAGTFSLLAGRQFTSAGALSNEGTLNLDAGSTPHISGAYTGSGTSTVAFTVRRQGQDRITFVAMPPERPRRLGQARRLLTGPTCPIPISR